MAMLLPCPTCARHVRRTETACPFCSGPLALGLAPLPRLPSERLGRAATFAFGAAVATSVTLAGCSGSPAPAYGAPPVDAARADSGTTAGDSGGVTSDAGSAADTGSATDAALAADAFELDTGGSSADYGAPPPP